LLIRLGDDGDDFSLGKGAFADAGLDLEVVLTGCPRDIEENPASRKIFERYVRSFIRDKDCDVDEEAKTMTALARQVISAKAPVVDDESSDSDDAMPGLRLSRQASNVVLF
jgi:hypothetical protein